MKKLVIIFILLAAVAACSETSNHNKAAFVTYLGNDTLAVEQFEKTGNTIKADVILRSPRTTLSSYALTLDDSGGIETMSRRDYPLTEGFEGEGKLIQSIDRQGDSLLVEVQTDDRNRSYSTPYEAGRTSIY